LTIEDKPHTYKKGMNWGYKIVFGLGAFVLFIVGLAIYMVSNDTDTLEDDDYYERSLNYDETYRKKENLNHNHAKPTIRISQDTMLIKFISADNKGQLHFKRPDDNKLDVSLPFATPTDQFKLPLSTFKKGNWNLEIDWKSGADSYLVDQHVYY